MTSPFAYIVATNNGKHGGVVWAVYNEEHIAKDIKKRAFDSILIHVSEEACRRIKAIIDEYDYEQSALPTIAVDAEFVFKGFSDEVIEKPTIGFHRHA